MYNILFLRTESMNDVIDNVDGTKFVHLNQGQSPGVNRQRRLRAFRRLITRVDLSPAIDII